MPFIWNNKEYKMVPDKSNWDKLEFVVARKLHVQYKPELKISIKFIKDEFEMYGSLEKIEIFHDKFSASKFAHVTFKENRVAYCALIDCKQQLESNNIVTIRPADAHLQPDNPVGSSSSPFYNLPDDCFLAIFDFCDFHTLAMLSTICKKMCELLRTRVFEKIAIYKSDASNEAEVKNGLLTVSRLVQCINPPNFHLKVCRNEQNPTGWPTITADMKSSKSTFFVETDFFTSETLDELEKIAKRIETIHVHRSIYDGSALKTLGEEAFPGATKLILSGYTNSCDISDLFSVINRFAKLKMLSLRTCFIQWQRFCNFCELATNLQSTDFTKCFFDLDINKQHIIQLAGAIKKGKKRSPLRLTFDRIKFIASDNYCYNHNGKCSCNGFFAGQSARRSKYNDIKQAFQNEDVQKYVYVQIGSDPDYD